jgi:hypothetical protein
MVLSSDAARHLGPRAGDRLLTDALLARGFTELTVLDISHTGLSTAQQRLGPAAQRVRWIHADITRWRVRWIHADITRWRPERRYRIWHDRAVFHFLTAPAAQDSYLGALTAAVGAGGHAIIGSFAADGPEQCSGLPVVLQPYRPGGTHQPLPHCPGHAARTPGRARLRRDCPCWPRRSTGLPSTPTNLAHPPG